MLRIKNDIKKGNYNMFSIKLNVIYMYAGRAQRILFLFTREESMLLLETWNLMIGVGICEFVIFLWQGM